MAVDTKALSQLKKNEYIESAESSHPPIQRNQPISESESNTFYTNSKW